MQMEAMEVLVSPVCSRGEERYAFVSFSDGKRTAEGKIPACKIVSNKGFTDEELSVLEEYMRQNLPEIKKTAAGIRLMDAFMK